MPLFRPEAMRAQDRLHGRVDLTPPTSWQTISVGIAVIFAAAIAFLSLGHYARMAEAKGVVESTLGTLTVSDGIGGTLSKIDVVEGQHVVKGQRLGVIDHHTGVGSDTLEARRAQAASDEQRALQNKAPAVREASEAHIAALDAEADGARANAASAREQITQQDDLIQAAKQDLEKAKAIAVNGFISQQEIRRREETVSSRTQEMSRMRQQVTAANATVARTQRDAARERADMQTTLQGIAGDQAQVRARAASIDAATSTDIIAPADGTVTGLTLTKGARLAANADILSIVPVGGRMRIRLELPPEAAASVQPGQEARIALDAFPYETYGTMPATIDDVTSVGVMTKDGPRFIAHATPSTNAISSYGQMRLLRAGMTATARIKTMDRTLMQWLLDPIYAVMRR